MAKNPALAAGASSLSAATAALAAIKAQRESMNTEQATLEIPLLEDALQTLETQGFAMLEALSETHDSVIHPMAKEQLGHIFTVIQNVPNALRQVIGEHNSAMGTTQTIESPAMVEAPITPSE